MTIPPQRHACLLLNKSLEINNPNHFWFRYMLLLKKKKYAAVTMEKKADGTVVTAQELKGLDIVRRDWSALAANAGKKILAR